MSSTNFEMIVAITDVFRVIIHTFCFIKTDFICISVPFMNASIQYTAFAWAFLLSTVKARTDSSQNRFLDGSECDDRHFVEYKE